ncbi:hypothetical protein NE237_015067 [Protea cynaroides]|uniref:Uncharacterized protein n=1 Tax=Protea cynaroides TaxID=273540 RepID=A0A9Q0KD75_9MAGN|nr:hypothetical protein NE237_015067 [Protea cynaroides]
MIKTQSPLLNYMKPTISSDAKKIKEHLHIIPHVNSDSRRQTSVLTLNFSAFQNFQSEFLDVLCNLLSLHFLVFGNSSLALLVERHPRSCYLRLIRCSVSCSSPCFEFD